MARKLIGATVAAGLAYIAVVVIILIRRTKSAPREERSFFGGNGWKWCNSIYVSVQHARNLRQLQRELARQRHPAASEVTRAYLLQR